MRPTGRTGEAAAMGVEGAEEGELEVVEESAWGFSRFLKSTAEVDCCIWFGGSGDVGQVWRAKAGEGRGRVGENLIARGFGVTQTLGNVGNEEPGARRGSAGSTERRRQARRRRRDDFFCAKGKRVQTPDKTGGDTEL